MALGGEDGDLASATSPAIVGTPTGDDFPNGKTWNYEYSVEATNAVLKHNLKRVYDPKGQLVVSNVYHTGPV